MENIYDLIENYAFDALTAAEQNLVLSEISRNEYETMRQTLAESKTAFQLESLAPSLSIERHLSHHFDEKYPVQNPYFSWLSIQIPVWFWLLSLAALVAFFVLFYKKNTVITPAEKVIEKVYVHEIDTIYIEKEVKKSNVKSIKIPKKAIIKTPKTPEKKVKIQTRKPIAQVEPTKEKYIEMPIVYDFNTIQNLDNQTIGQQLGDDEPEIEVRVW